MRGLIYRELYLSKKSYIAGFVSFLMIFLVGLLFRLSTEYGNLAKLVTINEDGFWIVDIITLYVSVYVPSMVIFFTMMAEHGIIIADCKSKWNIFAYTLPVSEEKTVFVKYLILVCSMLVGFIFSILNAVIMCGISDKDFTFGIVKNMMIIMTCLLIYQAINIPLLMKFKSKAKCDVIYTIVFCILLFVGSKLLIENAMQTFFNDLNSEYISESEMWELVREFLQKIVDFRDRIFLFVPIAIIAVIAVGYYASVRVLKGREK